MQAGRLNQRVLIQHRVITGQDAIGADIISYTANTSGPYSAEYIEQGGREFFRLQQRFGEQLVAFKIRYQPGLTVNNEDRLEWQDRSLTFDVVGVDEPVIKRELLIACRELAA